MISAYRFCNGLLRSDEGPFEPSEDLVWIDLFSPEEDEESKLEHWLGIDIPTRDEMAEIEVSSRLYSLDDAYFMTVSLPALGEDEALQVGPVTFVLTDARLITVRYHHPRAFTTFPARATKVQVSAESGGALLFSLLEAIVDREADILEKAGRDIDGISTRIFGIGARHQGKPNDFRQVFTAIGRNGDLISNMRGCLVSLQRMLGFLAQYQPAADPGNAADDRSATIRADVDSLADHASFLGQKVTFLLDATLGMIGVEQNAIIRILSVAAVIFLPPTLIASVYGMNFTHMPELAWAAGYPLALTLMVASAILSYWYVRRKGWLF